MLQGGGCCREVAITGDSNVLSLTCAYLKKGKSPPNIKTRLNKQERNQFFYKQ